jgi:hypothetical protein
MAQSARRRRTPQCLELVGLAPLAFAKGQLDRGAHAANDRGACRIGGSLLAVRQGRGEQFFGYRWHGERAGAPGLRLRRDERPRGGDPCGEHVALGDLVDEARFERLLRADRSAGQHQIERRRHADQPRQPLRSERARQQAEMDFRKPHSRARMRDPAMTRQGKLQAAAERRAVERRHHRLGTGLDAREHRVVGLRAEARKLERGDVTARDEGAPGAVNHRRFEFRVGRELGEPLRQLGDHVRRDRVHRRVVDQQRGDAAAAGKRDRGRHGRALIVRSRPACVFR